MFFGCVGHFLFLEVFVLFFPVNGNFSFLSIEVFGKFNFQRFKIINKNTFSSHIEQNNGGGEDE